MLCYTIWVGYGDSVDIYAPVDNIYAGFPANRFESANKDMGDYPILDSGVALSEISEGGLFD